jgi:hypothetical protein
VPTPVGEPSGDGLQRLAVRLAGVGLVGALLPLVGLRWPGGAIPWDPNAHARGMAFGFIAVFILGFLLRILPRARRGSLPHPRVARVGLVGLAVASVVDGAGLSGVGLVWLWGGAIAALGGPLLAAWQLPRKTPVWFEGWIGAGLLGMALASAGLLMGLWTGDAVAGRAPAAFLLGGATPVTLGLGVRMLPPMAGVGPPDRDRASKVGRAAPLLAAGSALGILHGGLWGQMAAAAAVGALLSGAAWSLRGLRQRDDGDPDRAAARLEPSPRILRATARGAFLCAGGGLLILGLLPAARSGGVHLIGLGFLSAMALGVASRVVPGFVRGTVRWPRLEAAPWMLLLAALVVRLGGLTRPEFLFPSAVLLLAAWALFAAQIQPCLHAPDRGQERPSRCPRPAQL